MAAPERLQRDQVRGAQEQDERRGTPPGAGRAAAIPQHDGQEGGRNKAGNGHGTEQGQVTAPPQVRQEGERRAQYQRSTVGGRELQEIREPPVAERL